MPENLLIAGLSRFAGNKAAIGSTIALAGRLGLKGLVLVSRGYLGPLAAKAERGATATPVIVTERTMEPPVATTGVGGLSSSELAILGLAATKLVYELGEIALYNPTLDSAGKLPMFALDETGRAPAMSLAHIAAAVRLLRAYSTQKDEQAQTKKLTMMKSEPQTVVFATAAPRTRMYAARSAYYGTAPRYGYTAANSTTSSIGTGVNMSSSRGCGTCGGSHPVATAPSTPTYDPCARGLPSPPRAPESCGCGGGSGCGCKSGAVATSGGAFQSPRTYDSEKCPTFTVSCETKQALRDCARTALCSFLECLADTLCPDGRFDSNVFNDPTIGKQLIDCVGQLACSFIHCVPEALCGPTCKALPAPIDCIPCDYAVEVSR